MQYFDEIVDINDFQKHEKICEGKFKKVFKVIHKKTNKIYAAKIPIKETYLFTEDEINEYYRDIVINARLNHPSINNFIGYSPVDFRRREKLVVVTDYATNGILSSITDSKEPKISGWDFTKKLINIYGIASAMAYLHSHNIIHCNLTSDNVLVDEHLYPKLFCFKHSKEIISGSPDQIMLEKSKDVYSFSILIYKILLNKNLFDLVEDDEEEIIDESIPDRYYDIIENCLAENPAERPTFEQITKTLETDPEFITDQVNVEEYKNYIKMIKDYPLTFDDGEPVLNPQKLIKRIEKKERSRIIEKLLILKDPKELMGFLNEHCDEETTSVAFDKCFSECPDIYKELLNEGVKMNNSVAHQKYALSLLFEKNDDEKGDFQKAKYHLDESIKQGFVSSYFSLALLSFQFFNKNKFAFYLAEEGASKGEINSRCLLGYFIAHGIGTQKNHKKGIQIMLDNCPENFRDDFATDIAIYCIEQLNDYKHLLDMQQLNDSENSQEETKANAVEETNQVKNDAVDASKNEVESGTQNADSEAQDAAINSNNDDDDDNNSDDDGNDDDNDDNSGNFYSIVEYDEEVEFEVEEEIDDRTAFSWFERAYNMKKTKATINNYGLCFLHGIGVSKDVEFAKRILRKGTQSTDPKSLCQLHFMLDEHSSEEVTLDVEPTEDQISSQLNSPTSQMSRRLNFQIRPSSSMSISRPMSRPNARPSNITPMNSSPHKNVEKVRKQLRKMIHAGNCYIPIQYAFNLYKEKNFTKAFYYFSVISRVNNPIAKFFVGLMKYRGEGCNKNVDEAMEIMKNLSNIGNDMVSQFFNDIFYSS